MDNFNASPVELIIIGLLLIIVIGCSIILYSRFKDKQGTPQRVVPQPIDPIEGNLPPQQNTGLESGLSTDDSLATSLATNQTNPTTAKLTTAAPPSSYQPQNEVSPLHQDARGHLSDLADYFKGLHSNIDNKTFEQAAGQYHAPMEANEIVPNEVHAKQLSDVIYAPELADVFSSSQGFGALPRANAIERNIAYHKGAFETAAEATKQKHEHKKATFTQQVLNLGRPYPDIKPQLEQGKIQGREKNWAHRYCGIFDTWLAAEFEQSIENLVAHIITPIRELNHMYPKNPFTPVLEQGVSMAEKLYQEIVKNNKELHEPLGRLKNAYKEAYEFTSHLSNTLGDETGEGQPPTVSPGNTDDHLDGDDQPGQKQQWLQKIRSWLPKIWHLISGNKLKIGGSLLPILAALGWYFGIPDLDFLQKADEPEKRTVPDTTTTGSTGGLLSLEDHSVFLEKVIDSLHQANTEAGNDQPKNSALKDSMQARYGIDVSHHQKIIDWGAVQQNRNRKIDFVVLKATEGQSLKDKFFPSNWRAAQDHFEVVGAYHFFNNRKPDRQAQNFMEAVPKDVPASFFPILDVEPNDDDGIQQLAENGKLLERMEAYIKAVEAHYGNKVIIYSGYYFYNKYLKGHFPDNPFWLAQYKPAQHANVMKLIHDSVLEKEVLNLVIAWQFTENGRVKGIPTTADLNYVPEYFWQRVVQPKQ